MDTVHNAENVDVAALARAADAGAGQSSSGPSDLGGGGPQAEPAGPSTAEMLKGALGSLLPKAVERFPSLGNVWGADDLDRFCVALAPLLDKYGLTPAWLAAWQVELTALFVCGPLVAATVIAVRADVEAARAKAAKDAGAGSTADKPAAAASDAPEVKPKPVG